MNVVYYQLHCIPVPPFSANRQFHPDPNHTKRTIDAFYFLTLPSPPIFRYETQAEHEKENNFIHNITLLFQSQLHNGVVDC